MPLPTGFPIDRVVVSTDDSHFRDFAEVTATAWRKVFPTVELTLAYVSDAPEQFKTRFEQLSWLLGW